MNLFNRKLANIRPEWVCYGIGSVDIILRLCCELHCFGITHWTISLHHTNHMVGKSLSYWKALNAINANVMPTTVIIIQWYLNLFSSLVFSQQATRQVHLLSPLLLQIQAQQRRTHAERNFKVWTCLFHSLKVFVCEFHLVITNHT